MIYFVCVVLCYLSIDIDCKKSLTVIIRYRNTTTWGIKKGHASSDWTLWTCVVSKHMPVAADERFVLIYRWQIVDQPSLSSLLKTCVHNPRHKKQKNSKHNNNEVQLHWISDWLVAMAACDQGDANCMLKFTQFDRKHARQNFTHILMRQKM